MSSGTGPDSGDDAKGLDGGDGAEHSTAGGFVRHKSCGEFAADLDKCAGADVDDGASASGGFFGCDGDVALDGAPDRGLHNPDADWLSQVPGIER